MPHDRAEIEYLRTIAPDVAASSIYESVYGATELVDQLHAAGRLNAPPAVVRQRIARGAVAELRRHLVESAAAVGVGESS